MMGVSGTNGRKPEPAEGLLGFGLSTDVVVLVLGGLDERGVRERRSATERWSGRVLDARRSRREGRCWGSTFTEADMMNCTFGLGAFAIRLEIRDAYGGCSRLALARAGRGRRRRGGRRGRLETPCWPAQKQLGQERMSCRMHGPRS